MSFLLNLIPGPYRLMAEIAIIAALVLAGWGYMAHRDSVNVKKGRAQTQLLWDASVSKQRAEALAESESNARETKRRLERQKDAQVAHDAELETYKRTAVAAAASRDGLLSRVAELTAAARRAGSDTATGEERAAGVAASGMLADMLGRTDALAELYARQADTRRLAGLQCERSYEALTTPH